MKPILVIVGLAAALTACAPYTLVEPKRVEVAGFYSVDPQIQWSRAKTRHIELWTVDGPLLESVRFFDAREHGDTLFVPEPKQKLPTFDKAMTATEVQEFLVDSMAAVGVTGLAASNLRPWEFGALDGFRFELSYIDGDGLEHDGIAVGAINEERLYLILYTGARLYYFPKYRGYVESIVASIQIEA